MATHNTRFVTTLQAGEDLSGSQYKAIALNDKKVANNGEEASGILLNKPESGEFVSLAHTGEIKFYAGAAISAGAKLTVTTSGWFTTAGSLDCVVGECKAAVTSGSVGTGLFAFGNAQSPATGVILSVTAVEGQLAGCGYSLDDNKCANSGEECNGVTTGAISSGSTGTIVVLGQAEVKIDAAKVCSAGDYLTCTTSGYFQPVTSGYYDCAVALENIGSGATGTAIFGIGQGYRTA